MERLLKKSCCFITPCAQKYIKEQDRLAYLLYEEVYKGVGEGYDTFYFGGCSEIDIIAAEQVLLRRVVIQKGDPKHIRLIAVLPYKEQAYDLDSDWRERYNYILSRCDEMIILHIRFTDTCFEERDRYMADRCSRVIAVYDKASEDGINSMMSYTCNKDLKIVTVPIAG